MVDLSLVLSVLLYTFGIILLIVLIILGIRLIKVIDRVDKLLDNVEAKINSMNGLFMVANKFSDSISAITENLVFSVVSSISRIFSRKNKNKEDNYE